MYLKSVIASGLFVFSLMLAGCGGLNVGVDVTPTQQQPAEASASVSAPSVIPSATTTPPATATAAPPTATNYAPPTLTPAPPTATTAVPAAATTAPPTATTASPAGATATASPTAGPTTAPPADYLDDRGNPVAVLASLVNALNRKEYARAYSYWEANSSVAPFATFEAGYANTASVELTTGPQGSEGAAGSIYYTVAATLRAKLNDGTTQVFVGCYTLHIAQPTVQGVPPFQPLAIRSGDLKPAAAGANTTALMATACPPPAVSVTPPPTPAAGDVSAAYYIDNRSDAVAVLSSLFNAINRHEYLRAYSYWETGSKVGTYDKFQAGYSTTASVVLVTGQVSGNPGAGQLNYLVPVTLRVQTTGGQQQTFVGCYYVHLSQPGIQTVPPFMPMGIRAANVQAAAAGADTAAMMAAACATPPQ